MRNIRAYDGFNGVYYYSKDYRNKAEFYKYVQKCIDGGNHIVEEYSTDLKDKYGVKIYEGDILKRDLRKYERSAEIKPLVMDDYFLLDRIKASGGGIFEVIGNISENPELLEEK